MTLKKASEHTYYFQGAPGIGTDHQGFISNAGVVVTPEGVVVVGAMPIKCTCPWSRSCCVRSR